jgi:nucleoid DNA-binding protein
MAATKRYKIESSATPRTKANLIATVADNTELSRKQVTDVFDALGAVIKKDLSKKGPGVVNVAGLLKLSVQRKPATKARKGINPFTGEDTVFKAKPARNVVKARPLKTLKDMV